ncbi:hypothetical protein OH77DRAFT_1429911 [Trametes cingulata]|nr:hypothetical protein OH77DRAFT_1429911 [Trametes cingulata]
MPQEPFSTLPVELLHSISRLSDAAELRSLLLVNRHLNEVLTPLLYNTIHIEDSVTAQKCIRTLSRDRSELACGRDLPTLVRDLEVSFNHWGMPAGPKTKLARRLSRALGRMTNLQHLVFTAAYFCSPKAFAAIAHAAAPSLRSLKLTPQSEQHWADSSEPSVLDGIRPTFSELSSVTFSMWDDMPLCWMDLLKHILTDRAAHLREITIKDYHRLHLSRLFRNSPAWSSLVELTLEVRSVPFDLLPATPNVRTLSISGASGGEYSWEGVAIPPDAFAKLETLECPYQLLPAFLPADAQRQRPIRTVRLDDALYDEDGGEGDYAHGAQPDWDDVSKVLSCLPRSAGPVTDLSIYIDWFDAEECWDDVAQHLTTLERLVIVFFQDPGNYDRFGDWGETLLAHTPRLHTLLLSDAPIKTNGSELAFMFAWDRRVHLTWLAEWDQHTDALRKVAFTTEFMWTKTERGWEAPAEKDEESDDDEEDEYQRRDWGEESEGSVIFEG